MGIGAAIATGIGAIADAIGAGAAAILPASMAGAAGAIGTVGADALVGAGLGAGVSALTGGKPGIGALTGALSGGAGGAGGLLGAGTAVGSAGGGAIGGALGGAAGSALTGGNVLQGAVTGGIGGYLLGNGMNSDVVLPGSTAVTGTPDAATTGYGTGLTPTTYGGSPGTMADGSTGVVSSGGTGATALNPVSQASGGGGAGGGLFGGGNNTGLMLGALSTLSSLAKPKIGTWQTPGPASNAANLGPYWNAPLSTSAPGRTATNPWATPPSSYYAYGGPEQTYFQNNSLAAYGFAKGGALSEAREFATRGVSRAVRGPGTGTSDSVPARLSDGEYVLTAADVSRIGHGSNEEGARRLDRDRGALAKALGEAKFTRRKLRHGGSDA